METSQAVRNQKTNKIRRTRSGLRNRPRENKYGRQIFRKPRKGHAPCEKVKNPAPQKLRAAKIKILINLVTPEGSKAQQSKRHKIWTDTIVKERKCFFHYPSFFIFYLQFLLLQFFVLLSSISLHFQNGRVHPFLSGIAHQAWHQALSNNQVN